MPHLARIIAGADAGCRIAIMQITVAGKVAIVTGASSGIGLAMVPVFLEAGAAGLVAVFLDAEAPPELMEYKQKFADRLQLVSGDVRDEATARRFTQVALDRFGRIDVLVNNAAVFATLTPKRFETIPEEEWDRVMAVNVRGMWNCVKAVAPHMRARKRGRIVNVASAIVAKGTPYLLHYVASKGAVIAMTRALARELGDDGIAVNAVAPGLILSDTVRANPAVTGFQSATVLQSRAFKRDALPEDVEGAVVFLASSESAFMTGQTLVVDGGSVFV